MAAFFVTGTGTDVGKTFVTAALARHFRATGRSASALKPVVSGFDPAAPAGSDPAILLEALGREISAQEIARLSPWRFRAPLSPDMAARAEGASADLTAIAGFCRRAIESAEDILLIEGVGGVMTPLDEEHTLLDLMTELAPPLILVGGSYLGAISHLLSAQDVLLRRKLDLRAIVVSESETSAVGLDATLATLAHFAGAPLISLQRAGGVARNRAAFAQLADLLVQ